VINNRTFYWPFTTWGIIACIVSLVGYALIPQEQEGLGFLFMATQPIWAPMIYLPTELLFPHIFLGIIIGLVSMIFLDLAWHFIWKKIKGGNSLS